MKMRAAVRIRVIDDQRSGPTFLLAELAEELIEIILARKTEVTTFSHQPVRNMQVVRVGNDHAVWGCCLDHRDQIQRIRFQTLKTSVENDAIPRTFHVDVTRGISPSLYPRHYEAQLDSAKPLHRFTNPFIVLHDQDPLFGLFLSFSSFTFCIFKHLNSFLMG